ncbi:pyridoxal phosphate-dependent decarboxylase family protein [Streptomyces sp. NPDC052236]|uniref:pyridoxal phosphate-dependent decarboxylase family protein n=1 Tax=Streptomyces sp. NPDC052236 TaxID=3365686 RepID=UPI0037D71CAA
MTTPPLAGGTAGPDGLRPLLEVVLDALHDGAAERGGPFPAGGPGGVGARLREAVEPVLPEQGIGAGEALRSLVHAVAQGSADPADPLCVAHLHNPPLALAVAADLAGSALNPSMDSWDQAPAASELEALLTRTLAAEVYPRAPAPDALVTTGGTESNQLGLLLARERHGAVQVLCGEDTHHSVRRGAWLLGLPEPVTVPQRPGALDAALTAHRGPVLVVATAGTTDTGRIDPLPEIADLCERHRAELHIDAAYGGPLLFSTGLRPLLNGLDRAHSVTLDLHKLGWQPVAAGLLAVSDRARLAPLGHTAEYLNADDDTRAGLPDLLGRSLRTTRRPDVLKIAVTLKALGRTGLGALVDRSCATARDFAELVAQTPGLQLYERPTLSTVLFRPAAATDEQTARIRRALLTEGRAVLGRARPQGPYGSHGQHGGPKSPLWLKATFLNPHATPDDLKTLIGLVLAEGSAHS